MNAADDFNQVVLIGHVVALAMTHFGMQSMDDTPTHEDLQQMEGVSSDLAKAFSSSPCEHAKATH